MPTAADMEKESKTAGNNPSKSDLAVKVFKTFGPPALVLLRNAAYTSLYTFSMDLLYQKGLEAALQAALRVAKLNTIASCFYCAAYAALTNLTKFQGNLTIINAGLAGCCAGVFRSSVLGFKSQNNFHCLQWAIPGIIDEFINSSLFSNMKQTIYVHANSIENFVKIAVTTASIGSLYRHVLAFSKCKGDAPFLSDDLANEFYAVGQLLISSSFLLVYGLHLKKDKVLMGGLTGCWLTVVSTAGPIGGDVHVYSNFLRAGLLSAIIGGIYAHGSFFPRPIRGELWNQGALPPFTLPLPKAIEDGFSVFHQALKKHLSH